MIIINRLIISRKGFTNRLKEIAKKEGVLLISLDDWIVIT